MGKAIVPVLLSCMSYLVGHDICNSSVPCMDDGCYGSGLAIS